MLPAVAASRAHAPALRAALAIVVLVWLAGPYWPGTVDDVYITVSYAWQWAETGALTWVDGERVEGYSNFLMVALLAVAQALGGDGGLWAQLIALTAGSGVLVLLSFLLPRDAAGTTALAAMAVWAPFCRWSVVGMETTLYALLLAGAWAAATRGQRAWGLAVGLAALASLTRLEGAAHLLAILAIRVTLPRQRTRQDHLSIGILAALATYHLIRTLWFDAFLPTPVLVKIAGAPWTIDGLTQGAGELALAAGVLGTAWLATRPDRRTLLLGLVPLLIQALVLIRAGGDWMGHSRLMLAGVVATVAVWGSGSGAGWRGWGVGWVVAVGAGVLGAGVESVPAHYRASWGLWPPYSPYAQGLETPFAEDLFWVTNQLSDGRHFYTFDAGMLSLVPGVRAVDMVGLVTGSIASLQSPEDRATWLQAHATKNPGGVFRAGRQNRSWTTLPGWMQGEFPQLDRTTLPEGTTQWFGHLKRPPEPDTAAVRLDMLANRFPSQPHLAWLRARSAAADGQLHHALELIEEARGRWPERAWFQQGLESVSFASGSVPLDFEPRGFALFQNGQLTTIPFGWADASVQWTLKLEVEGAGEEGAQITVTSGDGCTIEPQEVTVHETTELVLLPESCEPGQRATVVVEFHNDAAVGSSDRNVFVSIRPVRLDDAHRPDRQRPPEH